MIGALATALLLAASGPSGAPSPREAQAIRSDKIDFALLSDDGRYIAALGPGGFKLWDKDRAHLAGAFADPAGRAKGWWFAAWAFSPDGGTLAVSDVEGTVGFYSTASGGLARRLTVGKTSVSSLAFSPDGRRLATTSADHLLRVWDAAADKLLWVSPGAPIGFMRDVAFSPDGRKIAAVADDANVYVWEVSTGKRSHTFEDTLMASFGLAFTRDGKHLIVAGASSEIFVLNLSTGRLERTFGREQNVLASMKLSPRGDLVASRYRNPIETAQPAPIIVWDVASGKAKLKLEIPNAHFDALSWNEGGVIATSWSDGRLHVWASPPLSGGADPR